MIAIVCLVVIAGGLYMLPPVNQRLSWRLDFALAYLRGVVNPVNPVPTALPEEDLSVAHNISTVTPLPSMTPTWVTTEITPTQGQLATPSPT